MDRQPAQKNKYGRYSYNIDIVFLWYIIKCSIEIDINILDVTIPNIDSAELFTLSFIRLHYLLSIFTSRLCCYSSEGLFLFYLLRVISTTGKRFFHLYLVSYQDRLRNPKKN